MREIVCHQHVKWVSTNLNIKFSWLVVGSTIQNAKTPAKSLCGSRGTCTNDPYHITRFTLYWHWRFLVWKLNLLLKVCGVRNSKIGVALVLKCSVFTTNTCSGNHHSLAHVCMLPQRPLHSFHVVTLSNQLNLTCKIDLKYCFIQFAITYSNLYQYIYTHSILVWFCLYHDWGTKKRT